MDKLREQLPCPICGKSSYSWGEVGADLLRFVPKDAFFLTKIFGGDGSIPARLCNICGNIQMFAANFEENDS